MLSFEGANVVFMFFETYFETCFDSCLKNSFGIVETLLNKEKFKLVT